MSLKSLLSLVDDKLEEAFHRKAPSADKLRAKAIKQVEAAKEQFGRTEPTRGRKAWKANNDVFAFTPGYKIDGRDTLYIPIERAADGLNSLEKAIKAGELDEALIASANDGGTVESGSDTGEVKKSNRGGPKGRRGPLSAESLARRREKVAAAKAAANG